MMICGGAEAPITPMAMAGFCSMKAMSTRNDDPEKASRPFDSGRDGFVIGEGAGLLVLERLDHALKRGARIYGEMVGYGMSCDAYHIVASDPEGKGSALSMAMALKDSGLAPEEVDYINAHGTSTPVGDSSETMALKNVFGQHAYKLAVSSTKSMTTWEKVEAGEDFLVIEMDPGMAFGCGTHSSTSMCMRLLEDVVSGGEYVIDVGAGSGILAITAVKLGAAGALAVDTDAGAVRTARENVSINGLSEAITVMEANLLEGIDTGADIIVANIVADVILTLIPAAVSLLKTGALL